MNLSQNKKESVLEKKVICRINGERTCFYDFLNVMWIRLNYLDNRYKNETIYTLQFVNGIPKFIAETNHKLF